MIKNHGDLVALHIHDLACFATVFALSDAHQVTRLEVLGNVSNVDLEEV